MPVSASVSKHTDDDINESEDDDDFLDDDDSDYEEEEDDYITSFWHVVRCAYADRRLPLILN